MANPGHLEILEQGVGAWNAWRERYRRIRPDLSSAILDDIELPGVNFAGAMMVGASLERSNLNGAVFGETMLSDGSLLGTTTNLRRASFRGATLLMAKFAYVDLRSSELEGTYLFGTQFHRTNVDHASFRDSRMGRTAFFNVDLGTAKHLETVQHVGASLIDFESLLRSRGLIPKAFLQGIGVPDNFITLLGSALGDAIKFYSAFISYSSRDEDVANRLHGNLQDNGVRCWFAPEDMKIGDKIRPSIDASIRLHDKLLLILSDASVESDWVEYEVETALVRERREKSLVLFPVTIDDAVFETDVAWAAHLKDTRHIGDFRGWRHHDLYQKAFDRLLRDLKAASKGS